MKRILLAAAAVAVLAACSKSEIVQESAKGPVQNIKVSVAPFEGDNATKAEVTTDGKFTWSAGDQIGIYPVATDALAGQTSQQIVFKINTAGDASSANFTGTGWGLIIGGTYKYFSYYPYSASAKYNEATVSYTDNLNQSENNSSAHLVGYNDYLYAPQIQPADVESAVFYFKHLSALVEFDITVPDAVKAKKFAKMQVTASEAVFTSSGKYDPSSATTSAAPTITDNVYTDKLNLTFNNGDGFIPDASGKIYAYFLIAPAAVNGKTLTIKLWTVDGALYTASKTLADNIDPQDHKTYQYTNLVLSTEAEDLSANGTANCYIVSKAGEYKFPANVKGNGYAGSTGESSALTVTGGSAEVIWETVNTATAPATGAIVDNDVKIVGNYIVFNATGTEGNALIALKDAGGNILWSWHIWSTSADLETNAQTYTYNGETVATMMDRNLGALSATAGNDLTCGFLYQWGRPCPITGTCSLTSATRMATTDSSPSIWVDENTRCTLAYSAANPTHFIYMSNNDWLSTSNNNLWGSTKTMFDPCPAGWKVPDGVWSAAGFNTTTFPVSTRGRTFTSAGAYYPFVGSYRVNGQGLGNVGTQGFCWSSSYNSSAKGNCMSYTKSESGVTPSTAFEKSYGLSVRPCKE